MTKATEENKKSNDVINLNAAERSWFAQLIGQRTQTEKALEEIDRNIRAFVADSVEHRGLGVEEDDAEWVLSPEGNRIEKKTKKQQQVG